MEPFEAFVKRLYFDTTVYSPEAMELLILVAGVDNVLFASEMLGGVTTMDPKTGRYFDDNKPCLDAMAHRSRPAEDSRKEREERLPASWADPRAAPEAAGERTARMMTPQRRIER